MQVHVYFPDETSQAWDSAALIVDDEGVGPVGAERLTESAGLLARAGYLFRLDEGATHDEATHDEAMYFASRLSREALVEEMRRILSHVDG